MLELLSIPTHTMSILAYPIKDLKNIRPMMIEAFKKKNLSTIQDLIEYFPKRYEDRSNLLNIQSALKLTRRDPDFITTIIARCIDKKKIFFRNRQINKFIFDDQHGHFSVPAFNPYLRFQVNQFYILSGKVRLKSQEIQLFVNEHEVFDEEAVENLNLGRIVPIYSSTENLTQKNIRNLIHQLLLSIKDEELTYDLPSSILKKYQFPKKKNCLQKIHFPDQIDDVKEYKKPLIYEEFYHLQKVLGLKKKKAVLGKEANRYPDPVVVKPFITDLPYQLTKDQEKTLEEIFSDMQSAWVMNRMLQGDVGTGKTLVALISMVYASLSGYQSVLMAPTEILAHQHYQSFQEVLHQTQPDIKVTLLTGNMNAKAREKALWDISEEKDLIIIGTHAVIQKNLKFHNLRLVVIDEQQRFGVEQRESLIQKGNHPDLLSMTATPIPRSLFISYFGDMVASFLKEKPRTSNELETPTKRRCKVLLEPDRMHAYKFLIDRIRRGEQGYVVFPIIEESSQRQLRSLTKEYDSLKDRVFKGIPIGFIHGKKSTEEKNYLMEEFRKGNIKALLSTTVLEVGIDHHNATTMIIESAHQFGLSQLHQLRGRVGRGEKQGYCYLIAKNGLQPETLERLQQFCHLEDGFKIAELDLRMRGPGDLVGIKQSGIPPLKIGNLIHDYDILLKSRKDVYAEVFPDQEVPFYFSENPESGAE